MNLSDKIKYLLFDLDGTLLHFDLDEFVSGYLSLIYQQFAEYSWKDSVSEWILTGTDLMLRNDGQQVNQSVFLDYFSKKSGLGKDEIWSHFMTFYEQKFDEMQKISQQDNDAINIIEKAMQAGYQLVLATQPIFPEIAIRKRLAWAGLAHIPFIMITDIEKMSACKPSSIYFQQLMDILKAKPNECLMIGNDAVADMAAVRSGISTFFLITQKEQNVPEEADYNGNYSDLASLLNLG